MLYGLYLSANGAEAQSKRLDVLANNLANAETSGFKRDFAIFQAEQPYDVQNGTTYDLPGNLNNSDGGVALSDVVTDFSDGPVIGTGGTYDVALVGRGFFQISDGQQKLMTRNGRFTVDASGQLVTNDTGHQVLGEGGSPISIPTNAAAVDITADGSIYALAEDGTRTKTAQLALVHPESTDELEKVGTSMFRSASEPAPVENGDVRVQQGYLETSGTQSVTEMMQLIESSRGFETNINMIKFQDDALGKLLQSASRR